MDQSPTSPTQALPLRLTDAEVRELWEFLHGDIMEAGTRVRLRRAMGLCSRHAWGYAQAEIELWHHGAGRRGGHQPFDVCVLYEDLLDEAIRRLIAPHLPWHRRPAWTLRADGPCLVCTALAQSDRTPTHGYAGLNLKRLTAEANRATFTKAWVADTAATWRPEACRMCLKEGPSTPVRADLAVMCRPHLAERDHLDTDETNAVCLHLARVREAVRRHIDSMTQGGRPASATDEAGWIEALAWFTGWNPLRDWEYTGKPTEADPNKAPDATGVAEHE